MTRRFQQLDVFSDRLGYGNPLAVIVDGDGLTDAEMARIANWTNLSETTFLLPATDPGADYRVRIFTTTEELAFAGHPTLGTCRAWLNAGGTPRGDVIVQECGLGLVSVRNTEGRLSFAAPALLRSGPVDDHLADTVRDILGVTPRSIEWGDNGPRWIVAELESADAVLAQAPTLPPGMFLGVYGPYPDPDVGDPDFEVRAFFPGAGVTLEDPVTGSLNAGIAQIVLSREPTRAGYTAQQGTALGRRGRVFVERDASGTIWIGGQVVSAISGTITTAE